MARSGCDLVVTVGDDLDSAFEFCFVCNLVWLSFVGFFEIVGRTLAKDFFFKSIVSTDDASLVVFEILLVDLDTVDLGNDVGFDVVLLPETELVAIGGTFLSCFRLLSYTQRNWATYK